MNEQKEGKLEVSDDKKSTADHLVTDVKGVDNQIASIEEQLKKAQETLGDLQALKNKLEEDRLKKLEEARKEQELLDASKVREENVKLKGELKSYQTEINSLKNVIASLKDDLVSSTEQLQKKVSDSLKILEEADASLKTKSMHITEVDTEKKSDSKADKSELKPEESKEEEIEPKPVATTPIPSASPTEDSKPAEPAPTAAASQSISVPINKPSLQTEPAKSDSQPAAEPSEATPAPAPTSAETTAPSNIDEVLKAAAAASTPGTETAPEATKPTAETPTEAKTPEPQDDTISIEEELGEYEKIKQELAALEADDTPAETTSPTTPVNPTPPAAATPAPAAPTTVEANQPKDAAGVPVKVAISPDTTAAKPAAAPDTVDKKEGVQTEAKPEEETKKEEPKVEEKKEGTPKKHFLFFGRKKSSESKDAPKEEKPAEKVEQPEKKEETAEKPKEPKEEEKKPETKEPKKRRMNFLQRFKHKEKKKDHDDKPNIKADTASGGLLIKTAILLLILFGGGILYQLKNAEKTRQIFVDQVKGQVKGASTSKNSSLSGTGLSSATPEEKFKEAFVDAPFEDTFWADYTDSEYGISMSYPKNTSYKYIPVSSNSTVWFMRKNGYLMKIDRFETAQTLEEFYAAQKTDIAYKMENATFKGFSAIHLIQDEYLEVRGNIYYLKVGDVIYKIWYKTYQNNENPDDEQRVQKMLDSITFTNATPPPAAKTKKTKK